MNYCVKIIVGFRRDQEHTIDAEEAHKAYYLFLNPEARTVFSNGLAIKGDQIQEIVPDYHATMGWNPTHQLTSDDWNEINKKGVGKQLQMFLSTGKQVAERGDIQELNFPLSQIIGQKQLSEPRTSNGQTSLKELIAKRV